MDGEEQARIVLENLIRLKLEGKLEGYSIQEAAQLLGATAALARLVEELYERR